MRLPYRSRFKRLCKELCARAGPPARQPGIIILTYHQVGVDRTAEINVPLPEFRRQIAYLAGRYPVVPLAEAVDATALDQDLVVLTFDDGYRSFIEHAAPVLHDHRLPATVYVCPAYAQSGTYLPWDRSRADPAMDWAQLRALAGSGLVSVGSHTWSHRVVPGLTDEEMHHELADARVEIEERIGRAVPDFCYPKALWDGRSERWVSRWYERATVGACRRNRAPVRPYRLTRIPVLLSDTFDLFVAKVEGRVRWESLYSLPRKLYYQASGNWPRH